jgi:hypothetical protein
MLGDQYMRTRSHVAHWSGGHAYGSVSLLFEAPPPELTIDLHTDRPGTRQGVALNFVRRKGRIAGQLSERFVLWEDTAPFPVPASYVARRAPFRLTVWNVWEGPHGATMAWVADAGIVVRAEGGGRLDLACSSGPGGVRFDDCSISLRWSDEVGFALERPTAPAE